MQFQVLSESKIKKWVYNLCKKGIFIVDSLLEKWNEKCLHLFSICKMIWLDVSNFQILNDNTFKICKIVLVSCWYMQPWIVP